MSDLCPVSIEKIGDFWFVICEGDQIAGPFRLRVQAEQWCAENCEPMG
jgi:hypothetical protein